METKQQVQAKTDEINIGINAENRAKVIEILQQLLADEHVLYIKLRNYHWNVEGPFFGPLHDFFAEQYNALAITIDDIAERIRSLGAYAPGSMEAFKQLSRLRETGNLEGNATKMLENILADHEMIIQILRHDVDATVEEYGDAGTSDFLTALMEEHEKTAWMVRSHLRG